MPQSVRASEIGTVKRLREKIPSPVQKLSADKNIFLLLLIEFELIDTNR